jgi:hypothetical protein
MHGYNLARANTFSVCSYVRMIALLIESIVYYTYADVAGELAVPAMVN